jgi:hypothetical protein
MKNNLFFWKMIFIKKHFSSKKNFSKKQETLSFYKNLNLIALFRWNLCSLVQKHK